MILPSLLPDDMGATVNWLLATQHASGAWGQYAPTAEETALTLLALLKYHREVSPLPQEPLHRGARYLISGEAPFQRHYPQLWVSKALYSPTVVVRSTILAALGLYRDTFDLSGSLKMNALLEVRSKDPSLRRKGRVQAIMLLGMMAGMLFVAAYNAVEAEPQYYATNVAFASLLFGLFALNRFGFIYLAGLFTVLLTGV